MKFKPKNRKELIDIIEEISINQLIDNLHDTSNTNNNYYSKSYDIHQYPYGLKDVDVSLITDMKELFINIDINWNDSRNDISNWDTSNVTDMYAMFQGTTFNQNISTKVEIKDENGNIFYIPIEKLGIKKISKFYIGKKFKINNNILHKVDNNSEQSFKNIKDTIVKDNKIDEEIITLENNKKVKVKVIYNNTRQIDIEQLNDKDLENLLNNSLNNRYKHVTILSFKWDVSKVKDMSRMFAYSLFNQPIGNWNTENVINMAEMFQYSNFNQNIDNWNVSKVKYMYGIFKKSSFNHNIYKWKLNKFCDLDYFNNNSKHEKRFGNIDNYNDFYNKQISNKFIFFTLKKGSEKEKYNLIQFLKNNRYVRNRFITFLKEYNDIIQFLDI